MEGNQSENFETSAESRQSRFTTLLSQLSKRLTLLDKYYIRNHQKTKYNSQKLKLKKLDNHIEENTSAISEEQENLKIFLFTTNKNRPEYTFKDLIETLFNLGDHSLTEMVYGFILLERYLEMTKIRGRVNLFDLYKIAVYITNKFLDEKQNWKLEDYCHLVGMEVKSASLKEELFLKAIDYKVSIPKKTLDSYEKYMFENQK